MRVKMHYVASLAAMKEGTTVSRESESLVDLMCKVRPRTLTTSRALRLAVESAVQRKRFEVAGAHNSVTVTVFVFEFSS